MASIDNAILIIGGGHAAAQLCANLVEAGQGPRIHLVCEEAHLPYHRPPLSKAYLKSTAESLQFHRPSEWYAKAGIRVHQGDPAISLDVSRHTATLRSGLVLDWHRLVLATGARPKFLPRLTRELANVAVLRTADDARELRDRLAPANRVVVLGAGFIGLEAAATARKMGAQVTVVEAGPRVLGRVVSPELSAHILGVHRAAEIRFLLDTSVDSVVARNGRVEALRAGNETLPSDLVLLGIGASADTHLAEAAGIRCADGVLVDEFMQSSAADVLAIGDCARLLANGTGASLRLESVQNANDQARTAAATLLDQRRPHETRAWFWSDQGDLRLQIAGLLPGATEGELLTVCRQNGAASLSLFHFAGNRLSCVESLNAPLDHMVSRKLLESQKNPTPSQILDTSIALKALVV